MPSVLNPEKIAKEWFSKFSSSVESSDVDGIVALFLSNGWYKDMLALTYKIRSLEGHEKIKAFLYQNLLNAQISNVVLDSSQHYEAELFDAGPIQGVFGAFSFETPKAVGKGNFRLLPDGDEGEWKALAVMTMVWDWKGHEEQIRELGFYGDHSETWADVWSKRKEDIESDPQAIISAYLFVLIE